MASNIDPERPNVGVPRLTKDGFEDNFTAAKDEIEDLQSRVTALEGGGGGFNVDQYDIAGRLTVGTGGLEAVDIATLTDQASPASADDLLAKRASDGELVKIEVGNLPGGDVTSVFTRTGAVVAASDDYDDAQVTAAASATNYTPASSTVDGHLSGIDTALGTVGAVASVFTRTGAVVAVSGDYDADEIDETASNKIMTAAERTKLAGIETAATADQTGAEIKTAYEGEADTNAFTDAEQTKLAGVATGATDDTTVDAHIADAVAAHDDSAIAAAASATNYTPGASTVEGHLSGIDTALGTVGAVASVFSRTGVVVAVAGDYDDAEVTAAASATNYTPGAATVEGHLSGIDTALGTVGAVASVFSRTGVVVAVAGDYTASEVTNVASGDIVATTVQAAIDELDGDKVATSVTLTASTGLTGGGDLSANRSFAVDINGTTDLPAPAIGDELLLSDVSDTNTVKKADLASIVNLADHDALTNFVADEHVAHAGVTLTAGDGLTGGGTIAASRTFDVDINGTTDLAAPATGDELLLGDISNANAIRKADVASVVNLADHDALTNFVADEHVAHGGVTLTAGDGLSGGGTIAANRTFNVDISGATDDAAPARADEILFDDGAIKKSDIGAVVDLAKPVESFVIAASDETTALTTGTAKVTFRMPYAFTLSEVRASVTTAPTGSVLTVDINETAATILSTKITIDATEKTSETAATAPVISDSALADDAEITIDIDTVGSTIAGAGLKVTLIGNQA